MWAHGVAFDVDIDEQWRFREAEGACHLERTLGRYGEVRFVGEPGRKLHVEVLPRRDLFAPGAVDAVAETPEWHPEHPERWSRGELHHVLGGAISAWDPLATTMMMDLFAGRSVLLEQAAWFAGDPVRLVLSPVRFQAAYARFAECYQWLMPANYEDVARTRVAFRPGQVGLDEFQQRKLAEVAEYVRADADVVRVYVDGHTDATGSERDNMRVSEQRAKAVAGWLAQCGVPEEQIVVRYHASRYPVKEGTDEAARAANRRATVRLEKRAEDALAGV